MGFRERITDKFKAKRQKKELLAEILHAAGDGRLKDEEVQSLQTQFKELGLSRRDLGSVRVQALQRRSGSGESRWRSLG